MLERLSGEVNAGSGGVNAIFSLSNKNGSLQLGRSLKLDLKLPPVDNAVVIPNTALYGMDTIYKVSDRRLKSVPVSRRGDYPDRDGIPHSVIASPHINSGDIIMTTQLPNAVENLLVNPASSQ
jgi:hypothetical protein